MSKVYVTKEKLDTLASIVGGKSGYEVPLTLDEMITAADEIETEPSLQKKVETITPSATAQTASVTADEGYYGLEEVKVKVNAMPQGKVTAPSTISGTGASVTVGSNKLTFTKSVSVTPVVDIQGYVESGTAKNVSVSLEANVSTRNSDSLTASGATVTAPSGYYGSYASKTIASGTAGTPTASKGAVSNHSVDVTPSVTNTTGYITGSTKTGTPVTVTASELVSGTKSITANDTGIDVTEYQYVDVSVSGGSPTLQTKTKSYTPTESAQTETITADVGYDGLQEVDVTVGAISPTYIGSGVTQRDSTDLSASGATVSVPSGYYASNASKSVSSGTEGTPTATKGTVSSNSISVTPSVTNSAGYISGGTHNGTAVTVYASELVSGTKSITSSGTIDVANYANASVAAGSAKSPTTITGTGSGVSHDGTTVTFQKTLSVTPTVTAGYVSSGTATNTSVTLSATDANFLASNIKNGVSIFGLTGSYSGGGGGVTGVAKGTLTVPSNVNTSTNTKITDTATIGFTPKAFLFYRSDRSATSNHINAASFITLGSSYYIGTRTRYSSNALSTSGNTTDWTTQSSGYLYFNSNNVYFRSSSSYILAAGTWYWVAIE